MAGDLPRPLDGVQCVLIGISFNLLLCTVPPACTDQTDDPPRMPGAVIGRLVDDRGEPFVGCNVFATTELNSLGPWQPGSGERVHSSRVDGTFEIPGFPWEHAASLLVVEQHGHGRAHSVLARARIRERGELSDEREAVDVVEEEVDVWDVGTLVVPTPRFLRVRVTDEQGQPVAGAVAKVVTHRYQRFRTATHFPVSRLHEIGTASPGVESSAQPNPRIEGDPSAARSDHDGRLTLPWVPGWHDEGRAELLLQRALGSVHSFPLPPAERADEELGVCIPSLWSFDVSVPEVLELPHAPAEWVELLDEGFYDGLTEDERHVIYPHAEYHVPDLLVPLSYWRAEGLGITLHYEDGSTEHGGSRSSMVDGLLTFRLVNDGGPPTKVRRIELTAPELETEIIQCPNGVRRGQMFHRRLRHVPVHAVFAVVQPESVPPDSTAEQAELELFLRGSPIERRSLWQTVPAHLSEALLMITESSWPAGHCTTAGGPICFRLPSDEPWWLHVVCERSFEGQRRARQILGPIRAGNEVQTLKLQLAPKMPSRPPAEPETCRVRFRLPSSVQEPFLGLAADDSRLDAVRAHLVPLDNETARGFWNVRALDDGFEMPAAPGQYSLEVDVFDRWSSTPVELDAGEEVDLGLLELEPMVKLTIPLPQNQHIQPWEVSLRVEAEIPRPCGSPLWIGGSQPQDHWGLLDDLAFLVRPGRKLRLERDYGARSIPATWQYTVHPFFVDGTLALEPAPFGVLELHVHEIAAPNDRNWVWVFTSDSDQLFQQTLLGPPQPDQPADTQIHHLIAPLGSRTLEGAGTLHRVRPIHVETEGARTIAHVNAERD